MKIKKLFPALLLIITACNTTSNNDKAKEEITTEVINNVVELKSYIDQKENIILGIQEGKITFYSVVDGEGMVAESSTLYLDEEKTKPCLTKIIYKTGGFINVYWLKDQVIWIDKEEYSYIFDNNNLIATLSDNDPIIVSDMDKASVAEIPALANKILSQLGNR